MNSPPSPQPSQSPEREWPGWDRDQDLAAEYGKKLRAEMQKRTDIPRLVAAWNTVNQIPQRISPGDAESFLMADEAARIQDAFAEILHDLWTASWEIGVTSALQVSGLYAIRNLVCAP